MTVKTISLSLVYAGGSAVADYENLQFAFFSQPLPSNFIAPEITGKGLNIVGGQFSITLHTALNVGDTGFLILTNTNGSSAQSPSAIVFAGPVLINNGDIMINLCRNAYNFDSVAEFNAWGGAAGYGPGPLWIAGQQYWSNGSTYTLSSGGGKSSGNAGRPTFLFFGCSLSKLNIRQMGGFTTKSVADTAAGGTILNVQASNNLAVGDKVVVGLSYAGYIHTTITATDNLASTSNVTIADRLPRAFLGGQVCFINKYTTERGSDIRSVQGPYASAIAQLGFPVDILPGYGHIGGKLAEMLIDLPAFLEFYKPNHVGLVLLENDIKGGLSTAYCKRLLNMAIQLCINANATPWVFSCVPQTGFTGPNIAVFDDMLTYVNNIQSIYPQAKPINVSAYWQDIAGGLRAPLSSWTDGVHPVPIKFQTIGNYIKQALQDVIGIRNTYADIALMFTDMTGTGGTAQNLSGSPVVSAGCIANAPASVMTMTANKDSNDKLHCVYSNSATSTAGQIYVSAPTYTLPKTSGGQWVKGFVLFNIASQSNLNKYQLTVTLSDGTVFYSGVDTLTGADPLFINSKGLETCAFKLPYGVTTAAIKFAIEPQVGLAVGQVAGEITILEMGLVQSSAGEITEKNSF